jgi:hypothetical protein
MFTPVVADCPPNPDFALASAEGSLIFGGQPPRDDHEMLSLFKMAVRDHPLFLLQRCPAFAA